MRKHAVLIAVLWALVTSLIGVAPASGFSAAPLKIKEIKVYGSPTWPPYSMKSKKGAMVGASYDILRHLLQPLGIKVTIMPDMAWTRALHQCMEGELDLLSGLYRTPEREGMFLFSEPYAADDSVIFVNKNKPFRFTKLDDLIGRVGTIGYGAKVGPNFDSFKKKLTLKEVRDMKDRMGSVDRGEADYAVVARITGMYYIHEYGFKNLIPSDKVIDTSPISFAFSKESAASALMPVLNKGIKRMQQDGSLKAIIDKHTAR
jgi:polar amino acid transport system substrate-binding protein